MSKPIFTNLNGKKVAIEISEKDGISDAKILPAYSKYCYETNACCACKDDKTGKTCLNNTEKEKFGVYFKSLKTTYGMDKATEDMLYERLKSKDDYKVGDIVCDDSGYDGVWQYSFYKVVKITDKRVNLREYTCHNSTLSDTILTYSRRDDGTITTSKSSIRIYNKLKIADEYSFE